MTIRLLRTLSALLTLAMALILVAPDAAPVAAAGTASLAGTVTVPAGIDVTKVQVELWSPVATERRSTHPDAGGHYRFDGLAGGSYNASFLGWDQSLIFRILDESGGVWPISIAPGQQLTGMDVTLDVGATLSGRIFTNGAFDLTRVTIIPFTGTGGAFPDAEVHPDGTWVLRSVPTGRYSLRFGGETAGLPVVYYPSDRAEFSVVAGQALTGLDVRLEAPTGSIAGRVIVPAGASPSSVVVRAAGTQNWDVRTSVAADGSFVLRDLPVGGYALLFLVAGASPDQELEYWHDVATYGEATQVRVTAGETTRIGDASVGAATTVALTSSAPVAHVGDTIRLTATVTSPTALAGGTVEFRDGDTLLGNSPLASGAASLDLAALPEGAHAITARFLGHGLNLPSTSPTLTQWVSTPTPPTVTGVDLPSGGRLGGNRVVVRGSGFTGATAVTFGGAAGTGLLVLSPTQLQVSTPPGSGTVPVTVTTTTGTSPEAPVARFAYTDVAGMTPTRVVDSWMSSGWVQCPVVTGFDGIPVGATGVLVNVTTAGPRGPGYAVVYPDAERTRLTPPPSASTVNVEVGAEVANSAFVGLSPDGAFCVSSQGPSLQRVLVDVVGYTLEGSGIVTQTSTRLLDTRGRSHVGEVTGPVAPRRLYTVDVAGRAGVPDDAAAVLLNVTATEIPSPGNLRVFAGGTDVPTTSVLNYAPGKDKAAAAVVALSEDGTVSFWSDSAGPAQVVLDVVGYVEADSGYTGVVPERVVDTRAATQTGPLAGPLQGRRVYSLPVAGADPVPAGATAVVLNVTAIDPTAIGNLRVYPDTDGTGTTPPPTASSINYIPGRDIPNQVVVALPADGRVNFYSDTAGIVHLAVDVAGYLTAPDAE